MRCGEQVDEWYAFENHTEWRMCLFLVPRLTPVERPSSLLRRVASRSCLVVRMSRTVLPSVFCCE